MAITYWVLQDVLVFLGCHEESLGFKVGQSIEESVFTGIFIEIILWLCSIPFESGLVHLYENFYSGILLFRLGLMFLENVDANMRLYPFFNLTSSSVLVLLIVGV